MSLKIETMTFHNPTEHTLRLESVGLEDVGPGEECEIPLALCAPTRTDNGNRGKSPIEQVAPQLQPKNPSDLKTWKQVPPPPIPTSKIVSVSPRQASESPGVKALREQREADAKAKAQAPVAGKAKA